MAHIGLRIILNPEPCMSPTIYCISALEPRAYLGLGFRPWVQGSGLNAKP